MTAECSGCAFCKEALNIIALWTSTGSKSEVELAIWALWHNDYEGIP